MRRPLLVIDGDSFARLLCASRAITLCPRPSAGRRRGAPQPENTTVQRPELRQARDLTEQRDRAEVRATELDKRLLAYQPPVPALPAPRPRWWRRFASASAGTSINLARAIALFS
jgi:hypothetical protein